MFRSRPQLGQRPRQSSRHSGFSGRPRTICSRITSPEVESVPVVVPDDHLVVAELDFLCLLLRLALGARQVEKVQLLPHRQLG